MLTNATILRIDTPGAPTAGGSIPWSTGAAMSCRCATRDVAGRRQYDGAANAVAEAVADAKLEVRVAELVAALMDANYEPLLPAQGQKWTVQPDGGPVIVYEVRVADMHPKSGMSFWAVTLVRD